MERRLLLSGYALSSVPFPTNESGEHPANLVVDGSGNVYGTYERGGAADAGTVVEIPRGTSAIRTLASFNVADGAGPDSLAADASGNLYGTTRAGGAAIPETGGSGTVFKIAHDSQRIQLLAAFQYYFEEHSGLTLDASGNVYGNTSYDNPSYPYDGRVEVFRIPSDGGAMQTVASSSFDHPPPAPGPVTLDAAGNVYGTYYPAFGGSPTIFGPGMRTITSFGGAGVTADPQGNLYGTASGGTFNYGRVFRISNGSDTVETVASFDNIDGSGPYGLKLDGNGNLYGATAHGGLHGYGTVFRISTGSDRIETLFDNTSPSAWFALDSSGDFYGTTEDGGMLSKLSPPVPGDVDGDQSVGFPDLLTLAQHYNGTATADEGDLNGNGTVGFDDLLMLAQNYGRNEPAGWVPTPFLGHSVDISTDTIEAENFDLGPDGLAYHDTTPGNVLGAYRNSGVDIGAVSNASHGFAVGYTYPGEWLSYTVNAPAAGFYTLQARVANYKPGGTFHVEIDGQNVTGTMTVPDTGPWDTWHTITSRSFYLFAGTHEMRVVMDGGGFWGSVGDFDSFHFVQQAVPFHGAPFSIRTDTIQAEDFDGGVEGLAYHDTTPQNIPGKYRSTAVDVGAVSNADNGYAVGYTAPGEWLGYAISSSTQDTYVLEARVANYRQGGTFHVEIDGQNVTGAMTVPDTGPWDTWQTITSQPFSVSAGTHLMRVVMDSGGYWGNVGDFDYFRFAPADLVRLVSQDRHVSVGEVRVPGGEIINEQRQAATGEGAFNAGVTIDHDQVYADAHQSSDIELTPTTARFSVSSSAIEAGGPVYAESIFNVVFDVARQAVYHIDYYDWPAPADGSFEGPSGLGYLQDVYSKYEYYPFDANGTLEPGRYTLTVNIPGGRGSNVELHLEITSIPVAAT